MGGKEVNAMAGIIERTDNVVGVPDENFAQIIGVILQLYTKIDPKAIVVTFIEKCNEVL